MMINQLNLKIAQSRRGKKDEKISQDHDTPFSPPEDIQDKIDDIQQEADVNVNPHEWYDEDIEEATKTDPPN